MEFNLCRDVDKLCLSYGMRCAQLQPRTFEVGHLHLVEPCSFLEWWDSSFLAPHFGELSFRGKILMCDSTIVVEFIEHVVVKFTSMIDLNSDDWLIIHFLSEA